MTVQYRRMMNEITPDRALVARTKAAMRTARPSRRLKRAAPLAACCALAVLALWTLPPRPDVGSGAPFASLPARAPDAGPNLKQIDVPVSDSSSCPPLNASALTLEEAYADSRYGAYLPTDIPEGFVFESASRQDNPDGSQSLFVSFTKGYHYITVSLRPLEESDLPQVVAAADTGKYDIANYTIPFADSVPEELRDAMDNPIFDAGELSGQVVALRIIHSTERGEGQNTTHMTLGLRYPGDILASYHIKGVGPEGALRLLESANPS